MYHLHAKLIRRTDGRSATAASAYRAASRIVDQRTGLTWDFRRKAHVHPLPMVLPDGTPIEWADRSALWNAIEIHSKRQDAQVAREIEVALPHGLTPEDETILVQSFARWLVTEYGIGVDPSIHRLPGNHHAHLLTTTHTLGPNGIGPKARALDPIAARRATPAASSAVEVIRGAWEDLVNDALAGTGRRVDRRTLAAQGIDHQPQRHQGPAATAIAKRGEQPNRTRRPRPTQEDPDETQPRKRRRPEPEHVHQRQRAHRR